MYNIHSLEWDDELLDILKIPPAVLPKVMDSSEVYGECSGNIFESIPIGGMAGDQQAALFGQACGKSGMAKNTYGTGCFMLMHTGDKAVPSRHNLLTTVAWKINGKAEYALEGSVFIAGAAVQWLRDGIGIIRESSEIEALAETVADNGGVFFVPAFSGLGAPHWDPYARGTITGITRGVTAAHIARATLESIAFQTNDLLSAMEKDSGVRLTELRVDGGASVNNLLLQFQSDLLGVNVVRPKTSETTALGAAYLAGLAVGFWKDRDEIDRFWQRDRIFTPQMPVDGVNSLKQNWQRVLDRARRWEEA
jgi:glycerol kinase